MKLKQELREFTCPNTRVDLVSNLLLEFRDMYEEASTPEVFGLIGDIGSKDVRDASEIIDMFLEAVFGRYLFPEEAWARKVKITGKNITVIVAWTQDLDS